MKKVEKFIVITFCSLAFVLGAHAQTNQNESLTERNFKELLAGVNATFTVPDGFVELPALNSDKTSYQFAMELPNSDFEVRFQVNSTKKDWRKYQRRKGGTERINPDSLYSKIAEAQVEGLCADANRFHRPIPPRILQTYNADIGHSYFFNLASTPVTKKYQYALLVVIQKNHYGSISVICLGNERGPEFFKKINMLRNCLKFNS